MSQRNKIVIFYAWGRRNAGDHALMLGALELLCSIVEPSDIVVVTRYTIESGPRCPANDILRRFPSVNIVSAPFDLSIRKGWSRIPQFIVAALTAIGALAWPQILARNLREGSVWRALVSARYVLLNGGNLFFWHKVRRNIVRLAALAFPLLIARRLDIPYGLLPQTCGPFNGIVSKWIGRIFENAEFVTFRDSDSLKHAAVIARLERPRHALLPDLAFFLSPRKMCSALLQMLDEVQGEKGFFCVCLRTAPLNEDVKAEHDNPLETERAILSLLPRAIAGFHASCGAHCVIVVQVDHDRSVSEKLLAEMQKLAVKCSIIELNDPYDFVEFYGRARFLVSFRLHSMIFALSQGTPVMGIWRRPLGTKIPSMMRDMGLYEYAIELDDANVSSLLNCMKKLDENRQSLRTQICTLVSVRQTLARSFVYAMLADVVPKTVAMTNIDDDPCSRGK